MELENKYAGSKYNELHEYFCELTEFLDNITEKKIVDNINGVLKEKTSIVISHRLSAIRGADLILFMEDGRVVESGTHQELMARHGIYAETYEKQSKEGTQHEG